VIKVPAFKISTYFFVLFGVCIRSLLCWNTQELDLKPFWVRSCIFAVNIFFSSYYNGLLGLQPCHRVPLRSAHAETATPGCFRSAWKPGRCFFCHFNFILYSFLTLFKSSVLLLNWGHIKKFWLERIRRHDKNLNSKWYLNTLRQHNKCQRRI